MTVRILFDSKSSQVQVQKETGTRLTDLYHAIKKWDWDIEESPTTGEPLTYEYLRGFDVICILTRLEQTAPPHANVPLNPPNVQPPTPLVPQYPPGTKPGPYVNPFPEQTNFQYTPDEILAFQQVVQYGDTGLLLISDHGPFMTNPTDNQTINDCQLAAAFGVQIQPACFKDASGGKLIMSNGNGCLNPANYSVIDEFILPNVSEIQVHNSCAIFPMQGFPNQSWPIASLPPGVCNDSPINYMSNDNSSLPYGCSYALLVEINNAGYVIIAGNSGLSGNHDSPYPAQGLFVDNKTFQNKTFLLNCIQFLNPDLNKARRR